MYLRYSLFNSTHTRARTHSREIDSQTKLFKLPFKRIQLPWRTDIERYQQGDICLLLQGHGGSDFSRFSWRLSTFPQITNMIWGEPSTLITFCCQASVLDPDHKSQPALRIRNIGSMFRISGWDLDQDGTTASTAVTETKICLTEFVFHVLR